MDCFHCCNSAIKSFRHAVIDVTIVVFVSMPKENGAGRG